MIWNWRFKRVFD